MTWLINLGDTAVTFHKTLHTSTGAVSSGDAIPEFFVFQGTATAPVWASTMVLTDSTGFYRGTFTCVSCTGFTAGLYGTVKVRGVVSGTSGEALIPFFIVPTTTARVGVQLISASSDGTTAVQAGLPTAAQLFAESTGAQAALQTWTSAIQTAILTRVSSESSGLKTWTSGVQSDLRTWSSAIQTVLLAASTAEQAALQVWTSGVQSAVLTDIRAVSTAAQASIESTIAPQVAGIAGTDTTGVPAATATWVRKLDWLYGWHSFRQTFNRTSGAATIYNASTIAIATFSASDDGTTFVRPKASS